MHYILPRNDIFNSGDSENQVTQEPFEFDLGGDSDPTKSGDEAERAKLEDEEANKQIDEEPSKCLNSRPQSLKDRSDQSVNLNDSAVRRNPQKGARRPLRYLNLASADCSVCNNLKTFVNAMIVSTNKPRSCEEVVETRENEWH
jgi:hypothetical protein